MLQLHVEPRQRAPRTANEVEGQAPAPSRPAGLLEQAGDLSLESRAALGAECRDAKHAEREGYAIGDGAGDDADQLQTAAAQVADDAVRLGKGGKYALARRRRFLFAR